MDSPDLTELLKTWPSVPGRINARVIDGTDGSPKLQIRIDLGILQMEMTGRPDGQQPHGCPSLFEYHEQRLERYRKETGSDQGFVLSSDDCRQLREEAVQYYHRYVALFSLNDHAGVIRDTSRNLAILDLCLEYGETPDDQRLLEQFRPYILTMRTRSRAEQAIASGSSRDALAAIDHGLAELRDVFGESSSPGAFERSNEVLLLRGMRDALVPKLPGSQRIELQERLRAALDAENYELAAILRDELRMLG